MSLIITRYSVLVSFWFRQRCIGRLALVRDILFLLCCMLIIFFCRMSFILTTNAPMQSIIVKMLCVDDDDDDSGINDSAFFSMFRVKPLIH